MRFWVASLDMHTRLGTGTRELITMWASQAASLMGGTPRSRQAIATKLASRWATELPVAVVNANGTVLDKASGNTFIEVAL
eukprot:12790450-Prorocentrum_lima.AAC.1